jgi:HTH-type transcriptional regulator/antitoxin HigA
MKWVDEMFDKKVSPNSANGKKVEVALLLIKQYEDEHFSIPYPEPIETIKLKMHEMGLKNKDLVGKFGSKGYVSSLLIGRKPLTLKLAKLLHKELHIPTEVFLLKPSFKSNISIVAWIANKYW